MRLMADGFVRRYGLAPDDVVLVAAPVGHAVGFVYGVELALSAMCPMVLMPTWEASAFAQLTVAHRCTFVAAATPFLFDVVDHAERHGAADLESLRVFLCGGAPVSTALLERARAGLSQTDATAYYGTSECGGVATCPPDAPDEKKLTTDGLPLPGMEIRIEGGELQVRGPQLARGYWGARDQGRFRADGWFATGDEATVDADGYVRIGGRLDDRIVRGGVNVSPLEIEEVLGTHPRVREVAVGSTPDERLGERIGALVVAEGPAPTLDELRRHCRRGGTREGQVAGARRVRPRASAFAQRQAPAFRAAPTPRAAMSSSILDGILVRVLTDEHAAAVCVLHLRALGASTTTATTTAADIVLADRHSDLSEDVGAAFVCTFETHEVDGGVVTSETTAQAAIGFTDYVGPVDGPAARLGCDVGTVVTGICAVQAILAWLHGGRASATRHDVAVSPLRTLSTLKTILWAARSRPDEWVGTHVRSRDRLVDSGYRTRDGRITLDFPIGAQESWIAFVAELGLDARRPAPYSPSAGTSPWAGETTSISPGRCTRSDSRSSRRTTPSSSSAETVAHPCPSRRSPNASTILSRRALGLSAGAPSDPYRIQAFGRLRVAAPVAIPTRPLADVRVVDFGVGGVGPFAATLLAWLGADVVKVEAPERVHPLRSSHGRRGQHHLSRAQPGQTVGSTRPEGRRRPRARSRARRRRRRRHRELPPRRA